MKRFILLATVLVLSLSAACVRRTMTFKTVPEGATVRLNDQDIGQTPVTVDFTWYGNYDVAFEKDGYQTFRMQRQIKAPWYQVPPIDLFAEAFVPYTVHDHHEIDATLEPQVPLAREELLPRAQEFRDRALFGQD